MRVIIYGANIEFMWSYNRAWYQLTIYFFICVFIWENELRFIEYEARIYINERDLWSGYGHMQGSPCHIQ